MRTSKLGLDATIPWHTPSGKLRTGVEGASFRRVGYGDVALKGYRDTKTHPAAPQGNFEIGARILTGFFAFVIDKTATVPRVKAAYCFCLN